ncbi:MAG: pyrroline-5-carboxylate reductase [bacterium]|nr:pyrroline-5-carboxylate reductase [bacterium]
MSQLKSKTIGCIGMGNMGTAIISGLSAKMPAENLIIHDIDPNKLDSLSAKYGVVTAESDRSLVTESNIVIIAVKPAVVSSVLMQVKDLVADSIIVSVAAGITIDSIEKVIGSSTRVIRVMPNTPALIDEGMSVLSSNKNIDDKSLSIVEEIFSEIGKVLVLPESMMDAVTGLSGSGPAYAFTFIQAMTDGGVKMGIPRDKAIILAAQTLLGSARLVLDSVEDPIALRGKVTSPGGTTIDGVHILEKAGFSGIVMDAVEAATLKSKKLGEK